MSFQHLLQEHDGAGKKNGLVLKQAVQMDWDHEQRDLSRVSLPIFIGGGKIFEYRC